MSRAAAPFRRSRSVSRRLVVGAGASALLSGSRPGAGAQGTPAQLPERPHPKPPTGRDTSSWFVMSRPAEPGFITDADRFEVYAGETFELLGGFRSAGTRGVGVTANPARILLDTLTGPAIFDLDTGNVTQVVWDAEEGVGTVRLPDPRWATPTPARWSFFSNQNDARALLVDLDNATGVDLADTLVKPGETAVYPSLRFSPDGTLAAGSVAYNGFYLLDPEAPVEARLLDGEREDLISWAPNFSPASSRLAYVLRQPTGGPREGTLVVEDLESDDVIEIGPVGPDGFAIFPPDSNDELIVFDDGTVTRIEIEGGRELWQAESEAVALALGMTGNVLFVGSARRAAGTPTWQTIDLGTGDSRGLPELRGLTYYNGSYDSPEPSFQLMGPPYGDGNEVIPGPLAAVNLVSGEVTSLLDETSDQSLSLAYGTSRDSGIILYAPRNDGRYYLFDVAGGERRVFTYDLATTSLSDPFVSADGAAAGVTLWNNSGSGRMEAWLLDVAGQGVPEPFTEGRLWVWAGGTPAPVGASSRFRGVRVETA